MNILKRLNIILLVLLITSPKISISQTIESAIPRVVTVQPSIMVIPYTKQGEDLRTVLEQDVSKRIALTKIKEGFDSRGFNTIDFTAKLKATMNSQAMELEDQTSLKQQIIEMSGADIYVEAEVSIYKSSSGTEVTLILTGYDAFSAQSLSNKVGASGKWYTDDIGKLTSKAVEICIEPFLNTMNEKFRDITKNGRSVTVNINFDGNSQYSMDSEVGADYFPLSDALEMWFMDNSYNNYYHIQGVTSTKMILDDVRIPLKNSVTGQNYRPTQFALQIYKFIRSDLGLPCRKDVVGTTIYIHIQ